MEDENAITLASMDFNTLALIAKAEKEAGLKEWMEGNLKQGVDKDWEYTHIVWRRAAPKDQRDWSAMLLDPGTAKIMGYMGVRPDHQDMKVEFDDETGQGRAQMKAQLRTILPILYLNIKTGEPVPYHPVIAEGVGSCTNKEKRFRVKWGNYTGRALIADGGYTIKDLEDLKRLNPDRLIKDNPDIKKSIFLMPDPAAAGADNSLLKMAAKRAEMDAVFQIPGVAQRFSQGIDLMSAEDREKLGKKERQPGEEEIQEHDLQTPVLDEAQDVAQPQQVVLDDPAPIGSAEDDIDVKKLVALLQERDLRTSNMILVKKDGAVWIQHQAGLTQDTFNNYNNVLNVELGGKYHRALAAWEVNPAGMNENGPKTPRQT